MASLGFQRCYVLLNVSFLLLLFLFLTAYNHRSSSEDPVRLLIRSTEPAKGDECKGLDSLDDHESKCSHLSANNPCVPQGYIDYLDVFYCACGSRPFLGYALLLLWLLILFYLLANTASQYFCSSLESLSRLLRLSPSIAGITLLSLGNGAPDVFSSIVSFMGSGAAEVGLSSVLGGALFVTSIVVGVISILVGDRSIYIDRCCFVRDVCFYVLVLCCLLVILITGSISLWGSLSFMSMYFAYVLLVSTAHGCRDKDRELVVPLLVSVETQDVMPIEKEAAERDDNGEWKLRHFRFSSSAAYYFSWVLFLMEMPLYLPRRLTIPDVSEERWSKPFAVASVIFSPLLLATLWNSQRWEMASEESLTIYIFGGLVGMMLGIAASESTENSNPPRKCLLPWLAGGFLMSVIWAYITARELVSLLVSLGVILGISPSILGLTVLAWGNSLGDLMANVAMAMNGGRSGAQIAISGCYAGPMFNALVGLGLSFVLSSWSVHPTPFNIPKNSALFETFGFLIASLLWALVMLPRRDMKLDKVLGIGLLAIYFCFLSLRLSESLELVHFGR